MPRLVQSAVPYAGWAVIAPVALLVSYYMDPYVFAFATLGILWLSIGVGLLGLATAMLSASLPARRRLAVAALGLVPCGAVAIALAVLRAFSWA